MNSPSPGWGRGDNNDLRVYNPSGGVYGNKVYRKTEAGSKVQSLGYIDLVEGKNRVRMEQGRYWQYNSWAGYTIKDDEDRILAKGDGYDHQMELNVCSPGSYSVSYSDTTKQGIKCESCVAGKYSDVTATWDCDICPAGKYSSSTGKELCDSCPVGKHLSDQGTQAGHHDNANDCAICGTGKYQDSTGADDCKLCPSGTSNNKDSTLVSNHDNIADCIACEMGKYQAIQGSTTCNACPAGRYGETIGLAGDGCSGMCPMGTYSASNAVVCQNCVAGKYSGM